MVLNRKLQTGAAFSLVAAMIGASFLFAEDPQPIKPLAEHQNFRAKQILGSKVAIQGDTTVGTVDDIVLDEMGNVDYLIVANSDGKLVTVPWDASVFNVDKRIATIQITPVQFQQIPTYSVEKYPVFSTPAYRSQVYKYYGVTPGQERRIFRRNAVVVPK